MVTPLSLRRLTPLAGGHVAILFLLFGCAADGAKRLDPPPQQAIRAVADRVLSDFPQPPPFDWGEGVLMAGMIRAGQALDEPRYIDFVRSWADYWRTKGIGPVLEGTKPPDQGYCGHWGPGFPVMLLHEHTRDGGYLAMSRQVADYIEMQASRTREGGLGHFHGSVQLWVDTLYMVCPLFAQLSRQTSNPKFIEEAARQLDFSARYCQDPRTGLFYHMYDEQTAQIKGVLWARGNGWVVMSYVEVLPYLGDDSPYYGKLKQAFRRQMKALLAAQDSKSHLWHTVLDHPDTYAETSASAMILYAALRAGRFKLYDVDDQKWVRRTWSAVAAKVDESGHVFDVSGGTGPDRLEVYGAKVKGTYTWGTGAFLLAASELCGN